MWRFVRGMMILCTGVMVGCGGGGGSDNNANATFTVSPTSLMFTAELDSMAPASQTVTIALLSEEADYPDVTASGSAIVTMSPTYCMGVSTSNLDCSGSLDNNIVVTVPVPKPDTLGVGTHSGSIVIASSEYSITVPVTYTVTPGPSVVNQITPHPALADTAGTATIRGSGFSQFGSTAPTVMFGTTAATNVEIINNTTLAVSYPALAAGTYDVTVTGSSTSFSSTAQLVVTATQTYPAATIASSGGTIDIFYDAIRKAIYVAKADKIEKYTYEGSGWNATPVTATVPSRGAMAMSSDGQHLVIGGKYRFHDLDPDTLLEASVTDTIEYADTLNCMFQGDCFQHAAMTSNGEVVAASTNQWQDLYFYNVDTRAIATSRYYFGGEGHLWGPWIYGSAHGNRILVTHYSDALIYDATQRRLSAPLPSIAVTTTGFRPSLSADGTVIAHKTAVIKDSGQGYVAHATLAQVPDSELVSPDGKTVYGYFSATNVVRPFDVSATGTRTAGSDIALAGSPGTYPRMAISPDGKTLFVAGDQNIVIVPL